MIYASDIVRGCFVSGTWTESPWSDYGGCEWSVETSINCDGCIDIFTSFEDCPVAGWHESAPYAGVRSDVEG